MQTGKDLRIVFMGTPVFAVASLRRLVEDGYNIVAVVTMPDKPSGRGLKMHASAVKEYALEMGLRVLQPEKLKDSNFVREFENLNADLGIVIAFRMLPEIIWSQPRLGTFNLHASLLPQYRGAAPINWAIINGETRTGVTTFFLNREIDKGDIIDQREIEITPDDTAGTLHDKLMNIGSELVVDTVEKIATGNFVSLMQIVAPEELKPAPKIFKDDCRIDWSRSPVEIYNFIRGLSPYPTAWSVLEKYCDESDNESITIKIYTVRTEVSPLANSNENAPEPTNGEILSDGKTFVKVACNGGYVSILELQAAGKKRMKTDEFLRGFSGMRDYRLI